MKVEVKELVDRRLKYERDSLEALRTNDAAALAELRAGFEGEHIAIRDKLLDRTEAEHVAAYEALVAARGTTDEHSRLQDLMAFGSHRDDVEREVAIEDQITTVLLRRHAA